MQSHPYAIIVHLQVILQHLKDAIWRYAFALHGSVGLVGSMQQFWSCTKSYLYSDAVSQGHAGIGTSLFALTGSKLENTFSKKVMGVKLVHFFPNSSTNSAPDRF